LANKTLFDQLFKGIGDAVADIRQRVVEEPWFGRLVTDREGQEVQPETAIGVAVCITSWPQAREAHQPGSGEHERDTAPDIDMDR
jgi:hypothetical protein